MIRKTAAATSSSAGAELIARDAQVCWHPYTQHRVEPEPLPVVGAQGSWLELADGRRLLDGISSWWTCLHGHGHPRLVEALSRQAARLDHVLFAGTTHEPAVQLAERLLAKAPQGLARVFYSDNGSTAVEVAMKAAYLIQSRRGRPERRTFLALKGSYHGDTFGAMAASDPDPFFQELGSLLFDVVRVERTPAALEAALAEHGPRACALILEPLIQGAEGMVFHDPELVAAARRLTTQHGIMLIADEVMTGFGRTGTLFACEQAQVTPDLMCLSKGLTGGMLPMAVTLTTEEIFSAFLSEDRAQAFFHGHSYTANPLGCAVALASLDVLEEEDTPAKLGQIGRWIEDALDFADQPGIHGLRRRGGIVAFEVGSAQLDYLSEIGPKLRQACRERDVLIRPLGNTLYALPPASTTEQEAGLIAKAMREAALQALG